MRVRTDIYTLVKQRVFLLLAKLLRCAIGGNLLYRLAKRFSSLLRWRTTCNYSLCIDRVGSGRSGPRTERIDEQPFSFSLRQLLKALGIFKLGRQSVNTIFLFLISSGDCVKNMSDNIALGWIHRRGSLNGKKSFPYLCLERPLSIVQKRCVMTWRAWAAELERVRRSET